MKTAACYIRVSTDEQTEYSPDSQLKIIRDYAARNNMLLLEDFIFSEDGGKSGKDMRHRSEFMQLISVTKKKPKPFDVLLVWKFSRFARNQEESIVLKSMLKRNGIEVVSVSEPLPDGPFGSLVERIIEWSDEYYLTNLSQEVKRGMLEKASRGQPVSSPPIGYDMVNGKYVPNSDAKLVKGVFDDYLNGLGMRTLAVKYGDIGLKTKRGNPPDNRFIEYMLRNPVYLGKIRWSVNGRAASKRKYNDPNIIIVEGTHEPIISKDVFDRVQAKIDETKKLYGRYQRTDDSVGYMLKGLIKCSDCGATLIAQNKNIKPMLQCHNYAKGKCAVSHGIMAYKANAAVISAIENAIKTGDFTVSPPKQPVGLAIDYERMLKNENIKLERIKAAYQNGIDTLEEYKVNKKRITSSIEKIKAEISEKNIALIDKKEYIKKMSHVLNVIKDPAQPEDAKNRALRSIVEKIVFNKAEKRLDIFFYA